MKERKQRRTCNVDAALLSGDKNGGVNGRGGGLVWFYDYIYSVWSLALP